MKNMLQGNQFYSMSLPIFDGVSVDGKKRGASLRDFSTQKSVGVLKGM